MAASKMPESKWSIPTPDGKVIYGVLNKNATGQNKKAVLHIHGLTSQPYQPAQNEMAHRFPSLGYDVIRPYLYHGSADARKLVDCTIQIHGHDIDTIFSHFTAIYDEIFVVGHSYGGTSIMSSHVNQFKAVCLWDPTYDPSTIFDVKHGIKPLGDYIVMTSSGTWQLMGKAMFEERLLYTRDYSRILASKCHVPLQVILAGDRSWALDGESFHSYAAGQSNCVTIPHTTHCFYEEGTTQPVLDYTRDWFDQFSEA